MDAFGTIIGAISFGVTVCDGITTYCRAWKHQDDDVKSLTVLCETLKQLLQDIEQRVKGSQALEPSIVAKLNDTLQACARQCEAVLRLSDKYAARPATTAWNGRARELAQRLKFPFRKKTLEELKGIMIAFRGNVDSAMGFLKLDLSISTQDAIMTLQTNSSNTHITMLKEIQTISGQVSQSINTELKKNLPLFEDNLSQKINNSTRLIESMVSESSATISQSVTAEIGQILPTLEVSVVNSVSQQIDNSRSLIEAAVANLSTDIRSTLDIYAMEQITALNSILKISQEAQKQFEPKLELLKPHISGPPLAQTGKSRRKRDQGPLARQKSSSCTCGPNIGYVNYFPSCRWGFGKENEAFIIHKQSCPFWYQTQIITKYRVNFLLLQRLRIFGLLSVSRSPYVSISGWHISQNLTYKTVVPSDAPAFRVITRYLATPKFEVCEDCATSCSQDLKVVFQSGQGSPHDTLADGTTLIEYAIELLDMNSLLNIHTLWQLTQELLELGVEISLDYRDSSHYRSLWDKFQLQIFSGYSESFPNGPVSQFNVHSQKVLEFLSWLMKHDIEIPHRPMLSSTSYESVTKPWHGFKAILSTLRSQEDFKEETECGILLAAVLRQDKLAMEEILVQNPKLLETERNIFGHSAIHLAIGWPDGLEHLLRAADESLLHRDFTDWNDSTPLDYAIAFGCTDSIRLLADADVAFDINWNLFIGTNALDQEVSEVLLNIILKRFQQLLDFGKQNLPAERFSSLQIAGLESVDLQARALLNCLHEEAIHLPSKFALAYNPRSRYIGGWQDFWLQFGGLFHQREICPSTARAFFQAGFTNVDAEVKQITPLMNLSGPDYVSQHQFCFSRYFQVVEFFVEKGGRLDRQLPSVYISNSPPTSDNYPNRYRVIHRIAYLSWTGVIFLGPTDVVTVANLGASQIWKDILQSNTSDPCICACASGGCRPISLALKSSANCSSVQSQWYYRDSHWGKILSPRHWKAAVKLLTNLTYFLNSLDGQQLVEDVIRFLTFSALGLTHTCCYDWSSYIFFSNSHNKTIKTMVKVMNPIDIEEIREEEAELIEKLDFLVDGFMKDFQELGLPLSQFLLTKWQEAMFAELSARDEVPETLREQLKELGVRICISSSAREKDESDIDLDEWPHQSDYWKKKKQQDKAYDEWISCIRKNIRD